MIRIGETALTLAEIGEALAGPVTVELAPAANQKIARSHEVVARLLRGSAPIYGVNTGFGKLAKQRIAAADLSALQVNIVRSHAAGVGAPLAPGVVRLILL